MDAEVPQYSRRLIRACVLYPDLFPGGRITHHFVEHDHYCALLGEALSRFAGRGAPSR